MNIFILIKITLSNNQYLTLLKSLSPVVAVISESIITKISPAKPNANEISQILFRLMKSCFRNRQRILAVLSLKEIECFCFNYK